VKQIDVLIVDDHAVVRQGLRAFLESEGDILIVGEAGNGSEAIDRARELLPEIVLMDLVMPGMDGVSAIEEIRRVSPESRVLVLTSFGEEAQVFPAIDAGAMGYLLKDTPPEDLGLAIRCVARGYVMLDPDIAGKALSRSGSMHPATGSVADLTPREKEVLALIASSYTNQEIACELGISIKTVKTHVSNILGKLNVADRTQAALCAIKQGLATDTPR